MWGLRNLNFSILCKNRDFSWLLLQIVIFSDLRDKSRFFQFAVTIAHFPLNLRTKFAYFTSYLRAKYHDFYKCMKPITSTAFRMYMRTSKTEKVFLAHNDQGSMKHEQS